MLICMYVCMYVCMYIYIYIHTYIHAYIHTCMYMYIYTYTYIYISAPRAHTSPAPPRAPERPLELSLPPSLQRLAKKKSRLRQYLHFCTSKAS